MILAAPINFGNVVAGSAPVPAVINGTYFYYRATGFLVPSVTGRYTIGVNCADGCNLYIGDQQLVSTLTAAGAASGVLAYTQSSDITLTAGIPYPIVLEWHHGAGVNYELQLIWTPPTGALALIPAANLSNDSSTVNGNVDVAWWNGTSGLWYPGGNGTIDFGSAVHPNKHLDNIPDGATYARPLLTRINAGRPVIDFSEGIHAGKQLDNIPDGATYARVKATALTAGVPNATALASATDVVIASPANGDLLTYETSSSKWKNKPAAGGGGSGPADSFKGHGPLNNSWVQTPFSGSSNVLTRYAGTFGPGGGTSGDTFAAFALASFDDDQSSQITISAAGTTNSLLGLVVRATVNGVVTCYLARFGRQSGAGVRDLFKVVAGVATSLGSDTTVPTVGDIYKLSCVGTAITLSVNGVALFTATDSAITSGYPGLHTWQSSDTSARGASWVVTGN